MTNEKAKQQHNRFIELNAKLYNYCLDSELTNRFNDMMNECESNEERSDLLHDLEHEVMYYQSQELEEESGREEQDLRESYFESLL